MYKILIHKTTMPKGLWAFITTTYTDTDDTVDPPVVTKVTEDWYTDDLDELQEKYLELLNTYTREQIRVVEDLDIELEATVTDATDE